MAFDKIHKRIRAALFALWMLVAVGINWHLFSIQNQYRAETCEKWSTDPMAPDSCTNWRTFDDAIWRHFEYHMIVMLAVFVTYALIRWLLVRREIATAPVITIEEALSDKEPTLLEQYATNRSGYLHE